MLTEHLYTVIHQNEVRKAKKLAELTHKLELEPTDDDVMVAETVPVPLCLVMPMNQLTSHGPTSPSSTAAPAHTEPLSAGDIPHSKNGETSIPQHVNSDGACETAVSLPPQSADAAAVDGTTDGDSTVPSTDAV